MTMVSEAARALTDDTGPPTFESFYAAHFQRLSLQLFAYTGDFGQAQDVVQEAFCRALPRWEKVSHYDDPLAWLRKVAWNLATSRFRRLRVQQAHARRYREEHVDGPVPTGSLWPARSPLCRRSTGAPSSSTTSPICP